MRGRSATSSSSITSPLRSISNTGTPRTATPANAPTPVSPTIAGFSTITLDWNRSNIILPSAHTFDGSGNAQQESSSSMPDLNQEVAALSNKLIKAVNHQTLLDDSLASTKHELELSKARIQQLEAVAREHEQMMANGLLVDRKDVETEAEQFMRKIKEERSQRSKAERDKKTIELELEHLTTALFEEANKMVAAARKERDMMDRKNEQLRAQLADTEILLQSHQDQLSELKQVMQQLTAEREDPELGFSVPPSPAIPNRASRESLGRGYDIVSLSPSHSNRADEPSPPAHPTSFPQLITPVLRYDTAAYQDFLTLLRSPKRQSQPPPQAQQILPAQNGGTGSIYRLSTGSITPLQLVSMGMGIAGVAHSPGHSPTTPVSHSPSSPSTANGTPIIPLKETRFFKRVLMDDIEPTLRLDIAPGLSWLAKRNTMSAVSDGTLVIDPIPPSSKINLLMCTLCGEFRNEDSLHIRTHKMRTSDTDTAQKYPLCGYCVNRVRTTCDFIGFLKLCKEGLWKCESEADEKHAWEVCTGHRERMFWGRIGGGVVPSSQSNSYQGYYQGSVLGERNSIEYGVANGVMTPRKVSGIRSSIESQQGEVTAVVTVPPPSKTLDPLPASALAMTPQPPLAQDEPIFNPSIATAAKKDGSISPLRRIWNLGTSRVLGDRNSNPNKSLQTLTTQPSQPSLKSVLEERTPTENKENIPPQIPIGSNSPPESSLTVGPQLPVFERELVTVTPRKLVFEGGMDSHSSTRTIWGRERENSTISVVRTVVEHREITGREGEDENQERNVKKEVEGSQKELEAEGETETHKRREGETGPEYTDTSAVDKDEGQKYGNQQPKPVAERGREHLERSESPTLPGGWA